MPLKVAALETMLCQKLRAEASEGGKHTKYVVWHEGQKIALTVVSRSYSEMDDAMASKIARQLSVSRAELARLVACPMSREMYLVRVLNGC